MDLKEVGRGGDARHPWEITRFEFFCDLLQRRQLLSASTQILDVGSGDAWFACQLMRDTPATGITCWDLRYHDGSASELGLETAQLTLISDRPEQQFDLILMLDVLEHVKDDVDFLRDTVARNLRPGGTLLISVPAWRHLHSSHDHWLEHYRRYSPRLLRDTLHRANLVRCTGGGLFHSLLLPRSLSVLRESLQQTISLGGALGGAKSSICEAKLSRTLEPDSLDTDGEEHSPPLLWSAGPRLSETIAGILRVDNRIARWACERGLSFPGLSEWALCETSCEQPS